MARDVAIIGVGLSKWGELWEQSLRDIYVEAALAAIKDAGVDKIDSMYVGNMSAGLFTGQEHLASLMADYLGVASIPSARVESACASGGLAVKMGYMEVALGMSDVVLVGGVEKMTDVGTDEATFALATAADQDYEVYQGITFPGLYAMMARAHMEKYGTTREQLAHVAVKNHEHGSMNPVAQYPQKITVENKKPPVKIIGLGHATDSIALHSRKDLTSLPATAKAAKAAYQMANVNIGKIDLVEVHDCFTIAEIIVIEELGIVKKGKGGSAAESGMTKLGGKIPVNTSGGLKSKGHPVGATGVAQVVEIVKQLRGEAGPRQVKNARTGMTQNMGGSGGSTVVHIMEVM
ncbi:MAG: beta-ketoacyl synthase N-terminal-like domain-containing protein [Calditrichia bacterium]